MHTNCLHLIVYYFAVYPTLDIGANSKSPLSPAYFDVFSDTCFSLLFRPTYDHKLLIHYHRY